MSVGRSRIAQFSVEESSGESVHIVVFMSRVGSFGILLRTLQDTIIDPLFFRSLGATDSSHFVFSGRQPQ